MPRSIPPTSRHEEGRHPGGGAFHFWGLAGRVRSWSGTRRSLDTKSRRSKPIEAKRMMPVGCGLCPGEAEYPGDVAAFIASYGSRQVYVQQTKGQSLTVLGSTAPTTSLTTPALRSSSVAPT